MKNIFSICSILVFISTFTFSQNTSLEPIKLDDDWKQKIYNLAPDAATAPVTKKHKVLLFSLYTGFKHWVIPHADAVIEILSEKSGAFEVEQSENF